MPSVRSSNTQNSSGTNMTVNAPSGLTDGDTIVVGISIGDAPNDIASVPSGWAEFGFGKMDNGGQVFRAYWKVAASEGSSWTWTLNTANSAHAHAVAAQDADQTTPINASNAQNNSASNSIVATSVTTTIDNCLLIGFFAANSGNAIAPDGAMTEIQDNSNNARRLETAWEALGTQGATGTRTATTTGTPTNTGALIAIAPPAVSPASLLVCCL